VTVIDCGILSGSRPGLSRRKPINVMAGLVPAIHVFLALHFTTKEGVNARHKAGHDD
jgi:hypothetical protein